MTARKNAAVATIWYWATQSGKIQYHHFFQTPSIIIIAAPNTFEVSELTNALYLDAANAISYHSRTNQ